MGCHFIVGHSKPAITWTLFLVTFAYVTGLIRRNDICGNFNGRRMYLEQGERGSLTARNITPHTSLPTHDNDSHDQCSLELVTCPSCVIVVNFRQLNLSHRCGGSNAVMDSPCRCDYVWLSEPPNNDASGVPFCGIFDAPSTPTDVPSVLYRSQTRTVSIVLLFSEVHEHAFTLEYFAERNQQVLRGSPNTDSISGSLSNDSMGGVMTSPFFPALYPRDLGVEYVIKCPVEVNCRVRIIFRDFQLATVSIMEFYDSNNNRLEVSSGAVFRPPVLLTTGPSLMVRFYANGGTDVGYKAFYSFISGDVKDDSVIPITDCGGYVENFGGAITMMNMVDHGVQTYDCIWLIRPPKNYLHVKSHLYLKVESFSDMAGSTELQVLHGLTSEQVVLETLRYPLAQTQSNREKEHVINADMGYYISLRGIFSAHSRLAIAYASFSYRDCFTGSDFLCQNHRCIPVQLNCDGFDHCGDNSDEPLSCLEDSESNHQDKRWYTNTPNYYFPKMERYPDLKTATIVFLASSLGMIMLISALVVLLYHMGARARQQRHLQSQLQTISDLLDGSHNNNNSTPDEPPSYEAPPNYDEIINIFLKPTESTRRRRKRQHCTNRRSRSSPAAVNKNLTVSAAAIFQQQPEESPVIISRSCQTTPFPDSPPPPYTPTPTPEPSCSTTPPPRLSRRGAKTRESWLLFKEDTSTEEDNLTVTQQCDNVTNVLHSPTCNIQNQVALVRMNEIVQPLSESSEEDVQNNHTSAESTNNKSQTNGSLLDDLLIREPDMEIERLERSPLHGKGLQRMSYSFDAGSVRNDIETCDESRHLSRSSPELLCNCEGACGCANTLMENRTFGQLPRSMSEGVTLANTSENFRALDIYFSQHEVRSADLKSHL